MKKVIVNISSREKRYAVLEYDQVLKIESVLPNQSSKVGNIYMGKVTKVLPGMDAAFVDFGVEKNGFLHREELLSFQLATNKKGTISQYIRQGEKLLVQVKRDETGTKGAKLSGLIELSSESLVYIYGIDYVGVSKKFQDETMQKYWRKLALNHKDLEEGLIIRTAMENQSDTYFLQTLHTLREKFREIQNKGTSLKHPGLLFQRDTFAEMVMMEMSKVERGEIILDDFSFYQKLNHWAQKERSSWLVSYENSQRNIFFEQNINVEIENAMKKKVWLENGSYLVIEETEAFNVIDVNSGKYTGQGKKADTLFQTNALAAKEVAHQLRLRNISGIVLIDFINMENNQHKKDILQLMKEETEKDEMRVAVIGFTELGILQLTRKRTSPSLSEKMTVSCPSCGGSGKILSPETVAFQLERELLEHRKTDDEAVWVEMNPMVANVLLGENETYRSVLEEAIAKKIVVTITNHSLNQYTIKRFGKYQDLLETSGLNK